MDDELCPACDEHLEAECEDRVNGGIDPGDDEPGVPDPETAVSDSLEIATTARAKTRDVRFRFRGYWDEGGVCRIRVFEAPDRIPVIVCSEVPENANTSVTNLAEHLAAEVIARYLPHRFEHEEPCLWIEHYPGRHDPRRHVTGRATFDLVTFASWRPRPRRLGGVDRPALGEPAWRPMTVDEVAALIGTRETER